LKRVIIAGGTGHIGSSIAGRLVREGYAVTILSRSMLDSEQPSLRYAYWDGVTFGSWTKYIDESEVVINLCGKSVNCRYTESNKLKLIQSRGKPTLLLGEAIKNSLTPPRLWINASSSAYYGFSSEVKDERAGAGSDFPSRICVEWEKAFMSTYTPATKKIAWRLGVVLQHDKGLILPFVGLVKSFIGGRLGSGKQYFTWIDEEDFLNAALWTIESPLAVGIYNFTSPEPVTNEKFMKVLRDVLGVRTGIPLPEWLLKIGGKIIGTEPYLVLDGRRILPARLLDSGFRFQYGDIESSLNHLFKKDN
jgi:uncharacterized protein (TIGR01777 family)